MAILFIKIMPLSHGFSHTAANFWNTSEGINMFVNVSMQSFPSEGLNACAKTNKVLFIVKEGMVVARGFKLASAA